MAATAAPARAPHAAPPWLAAATAPSCSSSRRAAKAGPLRSDGFDCAGCSCSHTAAAAAFAAERRWSWSRGGAIRHRPLPPVQAWDDLVVAPPPSSSSRRWSRDTATATATAAASREMLMLATMLEAADSELLHTQREDEDDDVDEGQEPAAVAAWARKCVRAAAVPAALVLAAASWQQMPAYAAELGGGNPAYGEVGAVLELGVQLIYLGLLLLFLGVGTFLVVRQVLVRRELESAAKELQERVRTGEASSEEYYELGAIFLRKKLYTQANKYLEQAIKKWDGDDQDLAQVYNALGFSCYSDEDVDGAIVQYQKAVKLQPGYVTAWNNLGDALEKKKEYKPALRAYQEALQFDPANKIASARRDALKKRVERFQGIPE